MVFTHEEWGQHPHASLYDYLSLRMTLSRRFVHNGSQTKYTKSSTCRNIGSNPVRGTMHTFISMLFLLVAGHAVADFPLQGDMVATQKSRHSNHPIQQHVPWFYWMGAHALSHGLVVALVTGSACLGMCETALHFAIDFGKCEKWFSIHVDQTLHIVCKITWIMLLWWSR
jgi:hypothetical protein